MRTLLGLMLSSSSLLLACSGQTIAVGSTQSDQQAPEAGAPETGSSGSGTAFTAAQVAAAQAACNAPHGTVDSYSTIDGLVTRATGAWYLCTGGTPFDTTDSSAVFGADGQWHRLVSDGSGGLTMSLGVQDSGTYTPAPLNDASAECDPTSCLVTYHGDDGAITQFNLSFESGPRRMLMGGQLWFAPLGE
jgi:hypothetical protein